jgi:hypothetical protein
VIGLLCLIQSYMYGGATTKYLECTIIDAQTKLQSSRMSNTKYLHSFHGMVDATEYLGGEVGVETSQIMFNLKPQEQDLDVKAAVHEQYLGMIFIIKSNSKC